MSALYAFPRRSRATAFMDNATCADLSRAPCLKGCNMSHGAPLPERITTSACQAANWNMSLFAYFPLILLVLLLNAISSATAVSSLDSYQQSVASYSPFSTFPWYDITSLKPADSSNVLLRCTHTPDVIYFLSNPTLTSPTLTTETTLKAENSSYWEGSVTATYAYMSIAYRLATADLMSCSIRTVDGATELASASLVPQTTYSGESQIYA